MQVVTKEATVENTGTDEDFPGTFRVILSAPTKDRDGDTLLTDEWELPLPEHITFDQDHGMSVGTTIGSGVPSIDEKGQLIVDGTYSSLDRAQEVRTLVNEGHIRTTSVAFMTKDSTEKGAKTTKRELLNGAFVAIPSNREALVLSSKAAKVKVGARNSTTDAATIQNIHDSAAELGADCSATKALVQVRRTTTKTIAGSLEAIQERIQHALRAEFTGAWPWLRGTLPEGEGGTAVFDLYDDYTGDRGTFRQSFTDDGTTVTLTGERSPVDVMEHITPSADEVQQSTPSDGAADESAAGTEVPAADSKATPSDQVAAAEIQIRSAHIRAMHATATNLDS